MCLLKNFGKIFQLSVFSYQEKGERENVMIPLTPYPLEGGAELLQLST